MKGSSASSMIFACLISRAAFHRTAEVAVAAASCVTVVAHANMPGRGDVTSGVSFFAVCTYHQAPREKNEQQGIRRKKERERTREREGSCLGTPTLQSPLLRVRTHGCVCVSRVRTLMSRSRVYTHDRCDREGIRVEREMRFGECRHHHLR